MTLPRALFLDLDDTLLSAYGNRRDDWTAILREFASGLDGISPEAACDTILQAAEDFWADAEQHRVWRQKLPEARRRVAELGLERLGIANAAALAADVGDAVTAFQHRNMYLFPRVEEALRAFRELGVSLALVTNGASDIQRAKIDRFGIAPLFDHIQIEGEFGAGKPEPVVYEHLLAVFAVAPGDAWMVGDNLEWEVAAPQRHGIRGIWCDPKRRGLPAGSTVRPDHIVHHIEELLPAGADDTSSR